MNGADVINEDITQPLKTGRFRHNRSQDGRIQRTLETFTHMFLLPVPHFMAQYDRDLGVIRHKIKHPRINAHIVPQRAKGVKALVRIDEIIVRLILN